MANFIPMIGLDPAELVSVRTLVYLLRHPDPVVPELTLQALSYLEARASVGGIDLQNRDRQPFKTRRKSNLTAMARSLGIAVVRMPAYRLSPKLTEIAQPPSTRAGDNGCNASGSRRKGANSP